MYAARAQHGKEHHASWTMLFEEYSKTYNDEAAEIIRRFKQELPDGWEKAIPHFNANDPPTATRKSSGVVLNALASVIPDFTSGCADITNSTLNRWKDVVDFQHVRCILYLLNDLQTTLTLIFFHFSCYHHKAIHWLG